jgi:hypothetical protein
MPRSQNHQQKYTVNLGTSYGITWKHRKCSGTPLSAGPRGSLRNCGNGSIRLCSQDDFSEECERARISSNPLWRFLQDSPHLSVECVGLRRMSSSGMWRLSHLVRTDVSEELVAFIFRARRTSELGTLAITGSSLKTSVLT